MLADPMPATLRILLAIAAGSAAGGVLRYLIAHGLQHATGVGFPLGTLVVNVLGCFAIGVMAALLTGERQLSDAVELGLFVGVLGGFTTFSSFGRETVDLFLHGRTLAAISYILLSNGLGLVAVFAGLRLAARA